MMQRAVLTSLMLGAALTAPGVAPMGQQGKGNKDEAVTLQWRFKQGDTFYVDEKIVGKTTVTVNGKKSTEEQTQQRFSRFVVTNRASDGITIEQRIESWKSQIVGGLAGDQDDTKRMEQLTANVVFKIQMSPAGAITRFEGYDEFLKKLTKLDPAEAKKFKAVVREDVLLTPLTQIFDIMPPAAVKKGQEWKKESRVSMGPLGTFELVTTFTYLGPGAGAEQIGTKGTMTFIPGKAEAGDLGFKILKLDLTKKEAQGRVLFDNSAAKGRLVLREMTLPLAGTLVEQLQDQQFVVQFDGIETRTIRMMDKRP